MMDEHRTLSTEKSPEVHGAGGNGERPRRRGLLGADMSLWLMGSLVALTIPRTVLTDIGVLEADESLLYFVLALAPYAVWLAAAVLRRTRTPLRDHLLVGGLYGLSLILVHELFWNFETSQGQNPPQGAIDLAAGFTEPVSTFVIHASEFGIAMMIGLGSGVVMASIAFIGQRIRRGLRSR